MKSRRAEKMIPFCVDGNCVEPNELIEWTKFVLPFMSGNKIIECEWKTKMKR